MIARCLALLVLFATLPASASETVLARLGEPEVHAIMRHALAPGYSDPANFDVEDCSTQRNLDARGRAQARRAGEMIRAAGVRIDEVWSSRWCRCLDTAREMQLGSVREVEALNSFFENRSDGPAQNEELKALLDTVATGDTVFLVSHQVNISALLGTATGSGEIVVFRYRDGACGNPWPGQRSGSLSTKKTNATPCALCLTIAERYRRRFPCSICALSYPTDVFKNASVVGNKVHDIRAFLRPKGTCPHDLPDGDRIAIASACPERDRHRKNAGAQRLSRSP